MTDTNNDNNWFNDNNAERVIRTASDALDIYASRLRRGGGVTADSLTIIAKHLRKLLPQPSPQPAPERNERGQPVWPALCHSPNSCSRNGGCSYWGGPCPYPLDNRVSSAVDEDTQRRIDAAHKYLADQHRIC
jgi:hypothetical protein